MQFIDLQYFPPIYTIKALITETDIVIPLYERFRKMSFQNRMVIPAANGLTALTVPLRGGRENKDLLGAVRIDNSQRWQVRHWRTLTAAYRRSPWFEFYEPGLASLYEKEYEFLYAWNLDILNWVLRALKADVQITVLPEREPGVQLTRKAGHLRPSSYRDPVFMGELPVYPQVFQDRIGFQPNVSIADLVFNEGNNSRALLL